MGENVIAWRVNPYAAMTATPYGDFGQFEDVSCDPPRKEDVVGDLLLSNYAFKQDPLFSSSFVVASAGGLVPDE